MCTVSLAIFSTAVLAVSMAVTPAKDSFTGKIIGATGSFAGDRGGVDIRLAPGAGSGTRQVTITIAGTPCGSTAHCVRLIGRLSGTITAGPVRVPDVGRSLAIVATGMVKPLGHVSATGFVQGTGFIAHGRESLKMRVSRPGGTITIDATSGPVGGFTSP